MKDLKINIEVKINQELLGKALKRQGIKVTKQNAVKYLKVLKQKKIIANERFLDIPLDRETLLMKGFSLEK